MPPGDPAGAGVQRLQAPHLEPATPAARAPREAARRSGRRRRPMVLGVNGIRLTTQPSGVGRAVAAILECLAEGDHPFGAVRVYTPAPLHPDVSLPDEIDHVVLPSRLPLGLWEQIVLPRAHGDDALLLCPSYVAPMVARSPILLIHHGSYEGYPEAFPWWTRNRARAIYTLSARRATRISTVSEHSKRDIVRFYGVAPDKISVIPEGVDTALFRPIDDPPRLARWRAERFGGDVPFFLYIGKPSRRRNLPALIRAFGLLKRETGMPHKLLLVGMSLPGSPVEPVIAEMGLEREVVTWGFASHEDIALAYNAATALAYPSSYEGFGMPVLEAMACGTPAVALDNTAFPEFAGGIALLLEDARVDTLKEALRAAAEDTAWRARAAQEGPARAALYDWGRVTGQYVELMRRTLSS